MAGATVPLRIGKYEIIRLIAQSNDIVYEAWDEMVARRVAVKVLAIPTGATPSQIQDRIERFKREARAAGKLIHPNIATVYEVGTETSQQFIAMELVEGETLGEVIAQTQLISIEATRSYVRQLLSALECAHAAGVVHRDVKPHNIFITRDKVLKLADFGIARIDFEPAITIDGQIFGTPSYMAPEQVSGRAAVPASDLWAVGVIAFELATRQKPFLGQGMLEIVHQIQTSAPDLNAIKDSNLASLVGRLLEKDPTKRMISARDAIAFLDAKDSSPDIQTNQNSTSLINTSSSKGRWDKQLVILSIVAASTAAFYIGHNYDGRTGRIGSTLDDRKVAISAPESNAGRERENLPLTQPLLDAHEGKLSEPNEVTQVASQPTPESDSENSASSSKSSSTQANEDNNFTECFSVGSTESDLVAVMGTPDEIDDYGLFKVFHYGSATVNLEHGRVKAYKNDGTLRVK